MRTAIHAFKYDGQTRLAEPLGALVVDGLADTDWPIDVVSAVPLHESRLRERGYNQAALLAQVVAAAQWVVICARCGSPRSGRQPVRLI